MKKMLVNGAVFLVLFSASAGGSWYYSQLNQPNTETAQDLAPDESDTLENIPRPDKLPQIFTPEKMGPDAILALVKALEEREQSVIQKEETLKRQTYQANMILDDTQREQQELTAIQTKLETEIERTQGILQEIDIRQQELDATKHSLDEDQQKSKSDLAAVDEEAAQQVSRIAKYYAGMPETNAASMLKQLCDGGQLEFAAKVITALEEKTATKILVALKDEVLVNQLLEEVRIQPLVEKSQSRSRRN